MTTDQNGSRQIRRVSRLLKTLKGHSITGLSLTDLARELKESPPTVLRCLQSMEMDDLVRQLDSGRWALSIAMLQIAESYHNEMSRMHQKLNELTHRVAAGAHD